MYQHILYATDFADDGLIAESRAIEEARQHKAKLSIIHVVDYYPNVYIDGGMAMLPDIEKRMMDNAEEEMATVKARIDYPIEAVHLAYGTPKRVIPDYAAEKGVDLIVLGSHGRHGIGLLLGSTANGVLHMAQCDVLAVRVRTV